MYRKYMHSTNKRSNTAPVNEGLISWAKGKIEENRKLREENRARKEAEKAAAEQAKIANIEKSMKAKGRKFNHEQAYKKAVELANRLINNASFKELKRFFTNDYMRDVDDWQLTEWNRYEDTRILTSQFIFDNCRSDAEFKYYKNKFNEFIKAFNDSFIKLDKTYKIQDFDDDGCYYSELTDA